MTPAEELNTFVMVTAGVFLAVERPYNPQVRTYWDAYHYIATSLNVGYANFFPVTPVGKAIGGVVMTVGPALVSRALDDGKEHPPAAADPRLLEKLDQIRAELAEVRRALGQRDG
ncbi:MAG: two pore domain potassium channel family protein [Deltaproteobacteria bacterium]|nr:two pore domain potassium channel family protein [Deltaproteobacteria bacterium]